MKTIWKWKLGPTTTIDIPWDSMLLAVHEQHGDPHLWALVNPEDRTCSRTFRVYGTGCDMPDNPGKYIGIVHMHGGSLVFHVFEANPSHHAPPLGGGSVDGVVLRPNALQP